MKHASAFRDFLLHLSQIKAGPKAVVTLCTGSDEFLLGLCREAYQKAWRGKGNQATTTIDPEQFLSESFADTFGQSSMFDPATLFTVYLPSYVTKATEQLQRLSQVGDANKLMIVMRSKPNAALSKQLKANEAIDHVHCPEPAPYEVSEFISFQARRCGLHLDRQATKLVADCLGRDLGLIANELRRISFFYGEEKTTLSSQQIAPHLGLLKEEMVFRLRSYILERKLAGAEALLWHLLDRGESGLAVLGFLAKHCRSSLIVAESLKNGDNPNDIAKKSSLQKYLVSGYTSYVKNLGLKRLNKAMQECIIADRRFKSGRTSHHLLLSEIVQTLC